MPIPLVLKLLEELIDLRLMASELVIVWHSGEPLTLPTSYYIDAIDAIVDLCKEKAPGLSVTFDIQTNATLINDAWCDFFETYSSLINLGVSCDGPKQLHDAFRVDRKGLHTFDKVMQGMNELDNRGIKYNLIAVVNRKTLKVPEEFFDFFYKRRNSITDFHFNILASPILDNDDLKYDIDDRLQFYQFYRRLLELWEETKLAGEDFSIRNFSQTFERLATYGDPDAPSYISETSTPLRSLNMDADGNLTTFYAGLDASTEASRYGDNMGFALGNIQHNTLLNMISSSKLVTMKIDFENSQQRCATACEYFSICPGGFELIQWQEENRTNCETTETIECVIHVKALTDAVLDFIECSGQKIITQA